MTMPSFQPSQPAHATCAAWRSSFSGGPAPAANAVIASAASCFSRSGIEVLGMLNGYSHLVKYKPGDKLEEGVAYIRLDHKNLEGMRNSPGDHDRHRPGQPRQGAARSPQDLDDPEKTAPLQTVYDALRRWASTP